MKYGNIICDPNSEEAKKLIGKTVIAHDCYSSIANPHEYFNHKVLERIDENHDAPFIITYKGANWASVFIREVIEEPPQYRPYESMEEMVEDFKERFCKHTTIPQYSMPLVWVESKSDNGTAYLVNGYDKSTVFEVLVGDNWCDTGDLFEYYTYLDGSPVGKEDKE